jgi:hypothetical protein
MINNTLPIYQKKFKSLAFRYISQQSLKVNKMTGKLLKNKSRTPGRDVQHGCGLAVFKKELPVIPDFLLSWMKYFVFLILLSERGWIMAEEKKEGWLNFLALTTVIFAVCATLSTFKGGSFSTRSVLSQAQASNEWAYYQAKSIKGYIYDIQREKLELELKAAGKNSPKPVIEEYGKKIEDYSKRVKRYDEEKSKIEQDARNLEKIRDDAQKHSQTFGMAVIFLQIAILLSSIAALLKKKPVWTIGLLTGVVGIVYFVDGFFLFMK